MNKTQKNKRAFEKPFRGMISCDGRPGTVYIDKKCIADLERNNLITKLPNTKNIWYRVEYKLSRKILLLEVEPDHYKIVSGGKVGAFLQQFRWRYNGTNVIYSTKDNGEKYKDITIERTTIEYKKLSSKKNLKRHKGEVHHMWYRFCAVQGTIKELTKEEHDEGHSEIGNYRRSQTLIINSQEEFEYFIFTCNDIFNVLRKRTFSIEM